MIAIRRMKKLLVTLSASMFLAAGCAHQRADYVDAEGYADGYDLEGGYATGYYPYGQFDCFGYYPDDRHYFSHFESPCGYGHYGYPYYSYHLQAPITQRQQVQGPRRAGLRVSSHVLRQLPDRSLPARRAPTH